MPRCHQIDSALPAPQTNNGDITLARNGREISILGSQDGLTSLAIQLLSLAQADDWRDDHIRIGLLAQPEGEAVELTIRKRDN